MSRPQGNPAVAAAQIVPNEKTVIIPPNGYTIEMTSKKLTMEDALMSLQAYGYDIVKDEKTGKILRVENNKTLSEMSKQKYDELINKEKQKKEKPGEELEG